MKKQLLSFLGVITLLVVGCGGGGSVTFDNPEIIEDQPFYRVKKADLGDRYIKELFDGNDTLHEETYFVNDNTIDTNRTIPYHIESSQVYIDDNPAIKCSVIDSNDSVQFYCIIVNYSGVLSLYTTRWKTLVEATAHPED